ncbi:glucosamine-6-phosphate deaminase [Corynebacterium poyangense]|uniref:Glucosamine-6-phosphate deaminase n=1 Tax=Corynebacterium poyangense TaxID=2684405 RepID=A0A7H0SL24_9CORY|nr:glucosamine-6-phosphate deaminase [Corynebacterium poyangense]MBZ8177336.1 glucosamine-6-phosphate deaminase [Corynebacterium poyangense]QNQ89249.1 glucosamine-6-phosphate deaminase [Corynebacterium poyangense]
MEILIRPDPEDVAALAAQILAGYAGDGATLGLATGSTPLATYQELIRLHHHEGLSFSKCQAFLLDEYVGLPRDHEQSYYRTIRREFTEHIDIDDSAVHSPDGLTEDSDAAGRAYDEAIQQSGGVDIQLLGVGTNGHIGFNEPGSSLSSPTRLKTLHPQTVKDNARFFERAADVPRHVLTQGLGTISRARHLLLLATGEGKAQAVAALAEGPVSARCPASVLQLHPHATVIVDEAAAQNLQDSEYYRYADANKPHWQRH